MTASAPHAFEGLMGRAPEPGLESAALAVRVGAVSVSEIIPTLATWPLLTLSSEDPAQGPEHYRPSLLTAPDGTPMVAAFTSPDRAAAFTGKGLHVWRMPGSVLARGIENGVGIVLNPASEPTLPLLPAAVEAIRNVAEPLASPIPGSRDLTPLEKAIVALGSVGSLEDVVATLPDADVIVASSTDPGAGQPVTLAAITHEGRQAVAVWTHPELIRDVPPPFWEVRTLGRHLRRLLGETGAVVVNPGTGSMAVFPWRVFDQVGAE